MVHFYTQVEFLWRKFNAAFAILWREFEGLWRKYAGFWRNQEPCNAMSFSLLAGQVVLIVKQIYWPLFFLRQSGGGNVLCLLFGFSCADLVAVMFFVYCLIKSTLPHESSITQHR